MDQPSLLQQLVALTELFVGRYGYPALFGGIALESFGIPAPGQTLLIASAFLAAKGTLNIEAVGLVAWTAAVLGDNLGYVIGRFGGRRLIARAGVKPSHLRRVQTFFRRYGGAVVVVARFFEVFRQLNGIVAGIVVMRWWLFLACNALGAALWVGVWGIGAYAFGHRFKPLGQALHFFPGMQWAVSVSLLVVLVSVFLHSRTGRSKGGRRSP
jgi:membrane protein DedA with SNARE-associated domain